jgi:hypothetical protein
MYITHPPSPPTHAKGDLQGCAAVAVPGRDIGARGQHQLHRGEVPLVASHVQNSAAVPVLVVGIQAIRQGHGHRVVHAQLRGGNGAGGRGSPRT